MSALEAGPDFVQRLFEGYILRVDKALQFKRVDGLVVGHLLSAHPCPAITSLHIDVVRDLFALPLISGLRTGEDFVTPDEERALVDAIDAQALTPFQFQQWTGKRLTCSFGWSYDFQSGALDQADPMPDWLMAVRDRAAQFGQIDASSLIQALVIRYDPGVGIGWHRDRPIYDEVLGVSLEAAATMRFRRKSAGRWQRVAQDLPPRSVYQLSGEVRNDWEHSIAPLEERRYSVTFRSFSERGRRLVKRL